MSVLAGRRLDIERAKGLAILFVVFGHIVARADPAGVAWYNPLRRVIYTFHMPFFLYLSGVAAVLSGIVFAQPKAWRGIFAKRAKRLLIPFFAVGVLIVFGKVASEHFLFIDHQPAGLATGLQDLIWHTADSTALSVWYLFVLFVVSVAAPVLIRMDGGRLRLFGLVSIAIYFVPMPQYLYLDHVGKYAVFFAAGAWAAAKGEKWLQFVDRYWRHFLLLLAAALVIDAVFGKNWPEKLPLLPIGLISMPALHGLVRNPSLPFAPVFLWLGRNSFMIYLFNTIFIGVAKGALLRITSWDGAHFLPFAAVLMLAGSLGPIALRRTVFQHVDLIDRYTK